MKKHMIPNAKFCCIILGSWFLFWSCSGEMTNQKPLKNNEAIKQNSPLQSFIESHTMILFLMDGGCISCNKQMASMVDTLIAKESVGIVLGATGVSYDITNVLNKLSSKKIYQPKNSYECRTYTLGENNSFLMYKNKGYNVKIRLSAASLPRVLNLLH